MLHVQKFLLNESLTTNPEGALEQLKAKVGIKYSIWKNLVVLNYSQFDNSMKSAPIAIECRSLVLELGTWEVVSRSFDRFFNYGEDPCPMFDMMRVTVAEKVDGSLINVFFHEGKWLYRTRSMIMPEGKINAWDVTWKEHIEAALGEHYEENMAYASPYTFILELTSPENRIVTKYASTAPQVTLLAIRNNDSGKYLTDNDSLKYTLKGKPTWRLPRRYKFVTISDCVSAAKELRDLEEGFVVYNSSGAPVCKVKNPAYVQAHLLRGEGLSPKRIKDLIFANETEEYLALFPEDKSTFEPYIKAHRTLFGWLEIYVGYCSDSSMTQRDFAINIKDVPFKSILFSMRKGLTYKRAWEECATNVKYQLVEDWVE